jgi:putative ABC transport system permease protein
VFRDFRHFGLDSDPERMFMRPFPQAGWPFVSIVAKTAADPAAFAAPVKKALAVIEPAQPVIGIRTMDDVKSESLASRRNPTLLLTAFAVLALTLAAVGIAGVVGYTVVQRSPEIGVRMALGAQPTDVLRLIVLQSLTWVGVGLAVGVAAALAASRLVASLLYEVQPTDPIVLALSTAALATVALIASLVPARRAVRIDPLQALRCE